MILLTLGITNKFVLLSLNRKNHEDVVRVKVMKKGELRRVDDRKGIKEKWEKLHLYHHPCVKSVAFGEVCF